MKKLLLIPLFILSACSPKYSEITYVSDFTQHVKDGFHIFPVGTELKTKNYIPLASLSTVYQLGIPPQKETKRKDPYCIAVIYSHILPCGPSSSAK